RRLPALGAGSFLDVAHRELLGDGLARDLELKIGVLRLEYRATVTLAQRSVLDQVEDGVGEVEQAHRVRDGRAALPDLCRDGLGREIELVAQALERARRLDWVQVLA